MLGAPRRSRDAPPHLAPLDSPTGSSSPVRLSQSGAQDTTCVPVRGGAAASFHVRTCMRARPPRSPTLPMRAAVLLTGRASLSLEESRSVPGSRGGTSAGGLEARAGPPISEAVRILRSAPAEPGRSERRGFGGHVGAPMYSEPVNESHCRGAPRLRRGAPSAGGAWGAPGAPHVLRSPGVSFALTARREARSPRAGGARSAPLRTASPCPRSRRADRSRTEWLGRERAAPGLREHPGTRPS